MWTAWFGISWWPSGSRTTWWSIGVRGSWGRRNETRRGSVGEHCRRPGHLVPEHAGELRARAVGVRPGMETGAVRRDADRARDHGRIGHAGVDRMAAARP